MSDSIFLRHYFYLIFFYRFHRRIWNVGAERSVWGGNKKFSTGFYGRYIFTGFVQINLSGYYMTSGCRSLVVVSIFFFFFVIFLFDRISRWMCVICVHVSRLLHRWWYEYKSLKMATIWWWHSQARQFRLTFVLWIELFLFKVIYICYFVAPFSRCRFLHVRSVAFSTFCMHRRSVCVCMRLCTILCIRLRYFANC